MKTCPVDVAVLEAIPAPACVARADDFRIVARNGRFLGLVPSRSSGSGVGVSLGDLLGGAHQLALANARPRDPSLSLPPYAVRQRDRTLHCELHATLLAPGDANPGWYLITFWDVTDRFTVEKAALAADHSIRAANERLTVSGLDARAAADREAEARDEVQRRANETDALFAAISDVLLVYDEGGRVLRANPSAHQTIGSDPAGMTSDEVARAVRLRHLEGRPVDGSELPVSRVMAGKAPFPEALRLTGSDGRDRVVTFSAAPVRLAGGETGFVSVWRDVTEQERLIRALLRTTDALSMADQRKDEFLAILSHELRNPLTPIRNSLYVLERTVPGSDQARRAQCVIGRQVSHLARLVDDLLDLNRITRGKIQLKRECFSLRELVLRTAEDHKPSFASRSLAFELKVASEPLWIEADPMRMVQAIGNLLQNAEKFTPSGGRVEARLFPEADCAVLTVRDTGAGIASGVIERLFEPFVQADSTLARSGGGLGLGLALVKNLVELHGGTVSATSEGLGHGAEFRMRLPLSSPPKEAASSPEQARPEQRVRVLVVEDNPDAAESLLDALVMMGYEGETAASGPAALALAKQCVPDVVLCDIGLPEMDGYQVARAFGADPELRSCHVVALTGYARPEDRQRAAEAGFLAHIAKPPSLTALSALLSRVAADRAYRGCSGHAPR